MPTPERVFIEAGVGNEPSHIGKDKSGSTLYHMAPFGIDVDMVGINPGNRSGHHAKVQVILEGMGIAGLAL